MKKKLCKCGSYYHTHVQYPDHSCTGCDCICNQEIIAYKTDYDYDLTTKINIPLVWYITDTYDTHVLCVNFDGVWFKLNDDSLLKEVIQRELEEFEAKDWQWLCDNVYKLPTIEGGEV